MGIDQITYLEVHDAIKLHVLLMRRVGETRFGVFDRALVESALSRPKHAAAFEDADVVGQAATLLYGLIRSHPWVGGNKRTGSFLTNVFLKRNGVKLVAKTKDLVDLCLKIESRQISVMSIENWMRMHVNIIED